jgi:hypothetical protein
MFPTIDGHFWVVREGKIIDPVFPDEYKMICGVRKADWKDRFNLPANEMTQKIMIGMFKKVFSNLMNREGDTSFEEQVTQFAILTNSTFGNTNPKMNKCFQNALLEIHERGGELVFGSLGFKFQGKEGYWYEFGGQEYNSVKSFLI